MHFTKMHGAGNDYLYVYGEPPKDAAKLAIRLSDRHFGIGADGIIFISFSDKADFRMHMYNADGSKGAMCGNGIRCVGKYVYDKGYTDKTVLKIETDSGIKTLELEVKDGLAKAASVAMGIAQIGAEKTIEVLGKKITYIPVSIGNPHAVVFTDDAEGAPVDTVGRAMERAEAFLPDGVNVEFVEVKNPKTLRMRVWERGSGITLACGTGASASAAAAANKGLCPFDEEIDVILDGGTLKITVSEDFNVIMKGPAETVFEGEVPCLPC